MKVSVSWSSRFFLVLLFMSVVFGQAAAQTVPSWFFQTREGEAVGVSLPNMENPQLRQNQAISMALMHWCLRNREERPVIDQFYTTESGPGQEEKTTGQRQFAIKEKRMLSYKIVDRYVNENGEEFVRLQVDPNGNGLTFAMSLYGRLYTESSGQQFSFEDEWGAIFMMEVASGPSFSFESYYLRDERDQKARMEDLKHVFTLKIASEEGLSEQISYNFHKNEGLVTYDAQPADQKDQVRGYPTEGRPLYVAMCQVLFSCMENVPEEQITLLPEFLGLGELEIQKKGSRRRGVQQIPALQYRMQVYHFQMNARERNQLAIEEALRKEPAPSFGTEAFRKALDQPVGEKK